MKPETLEDRLLKRIDRKRGDVFLRADFEDLGGYDQVGRVLRELVRKGRLVRVGQGLYARARPSIDERRAGACRRAERAEGGARAGLAWKRCRAGLSRPTTPDAPHRCRPAAWSV